MSAMRIKVSCSTPSVPACGLSAKVNLSEKVRETILRRQAEEGDADAEPMPPADLFNEAFVEVSVLLQRDSYVKFQNTEAFRKFKHRWVQQVGAYGLIAAHASRWQPYPETGARSMLSVKWAKYNSRRYRPTYHRV